MNQIQHNSALLPCPTYYTLGFFFNPTMTKVLMLRKMRPDWQRGKLNGFGGHIEENETPDACIDREFKEEIKYHSEVKWTGYATIKGETFEVFCFAGIGNIEAATSLTDEIVEVVDVEKLSRNSWVIENIPWLVELAIDTLADGQPVFSYIDYQSNRPTPEPVGERPTHPEDFCQKCHCKNPIWFAPNELWNNNHGKFNILCPSCFATSCKEGFVFKLDMEPLTPTPDLNGIAERLLKEISNVFIEQVAGLRDNVNEVAKGIVVVHLLEATAPLERELKETYEKIDRLNENDKRAIQELQSQLTAANEQIRFQNLGLKSANELCEKLEAKDIASIQELKVRSVEIDIKQEKLDTANEKLRVLVQGIEEKISHHWIDVENLKKGIRTLLTTAKGGKA